MSENARSMADLDRRIERLESRGDGRSSERAGALREVREYVARNRLLPDTAQTRSPRRPQRADAPAERKEAERRTRGAAQGQRDRRRSGRDAR